MPYTDYELHKEKARERYHKKSKEEKQAYYERSREWHKNNPEVMRKSQRKRTLKKVGWTPEAFNLAKQEQEGKCAICGLIPEPNKKQNAEQGLVADHKHTTPPTPRGLLCGCCNAGIGFLKESPEILKAAIAYLAKFP